MMRDIVEEHLQEASWIYDVRARLLRSYDVTLDDLAAWDERWLAQIDGLVIGEAASRAIVEQALEKGDEGIACAAAAVYATWGAPADRFEVEARLADPSFPHRVPFVLGLCLAPERRHEAWIPAWTKAEATGLLTAALDVMRFRGIAPAQEELRPLFRADRQPAEAVRRAARLVGDLKVPGCNAWVEALLEAPDQATAATAIESAVLLGLRGARDRFRARVKQAGPAADPGALEMLGVLGVAEDLGLLVAALAEERLAHAALAALGWLGHPGAAGPLISAMEDPRAAPLAGHAFSMLFGVDLDAEEPGATPAVPQGEAAIEDDAADRLEPFPGLPSPDPLAVAAWWRKNSDRFPRGTRWRDGRPLDAAATDRTLQAGPLADRPAAALERALTIPQARRLATDDLAARQKGAAIRPAAAVARPPAPAARPIERKPQISL